jgi:hypothetical protein
MKRLIAALLTALCLSPPAGAEDTGPNLGASAPGTPGPVRSLVLAWDLYAEGLRREDATLLLTATRLARATTPRAATGWVTEAVPAEPPPPTGLPQDPATPEALALAMLMAEGDPDLADLAADAEAELSRGRLGDGSLPTFTATVPAGGVDLYRIVFNGDLPAEIALIGDGSGNLELAVTDENGHPVCRDAGPTDRAFCAFTPRWNGWFEVAVSNPSDTANTYRLITN